MWYQKEAGGIFLCLNIKRDEYDTWSLLFSMSAYAARAQQKLQQAVRTNSSAFEFVQHFVSMTAALLCCYSKPSERAAPRSARSEIYATLRYHVSYHTSTFNGIHTHMHVSSSPGEAHHSFFCETCPPFASLSACPFRFL